MCLQGPFHGYELPSAFLTTFVLASRLASISALPYTFIVVEIWACLISFCCTPIGAPCRPARNGTCGEGMPPDPVVLPCCFPAFLMERQAFAIGRWTILLTPHPNARPRTWDTPPGSIPPFPAPGKTETLPLGAC